MFRRTLFAAALLCAISAHAIELRAPVDGATLRGGRFATLAWDATSLPAGAEEWEAFASVDGGRYYCTRLTPHLDTTVRRFDVLVPNVDSDDVRFLIRTGDERTETIIELPQRFHIRAQSIAIETTIPASTSPESARPGDRPVATWSSGTRSGASSHIEVAAVPTQLVARIGTQPHRSASAVSPRPATVNVANASPEFTVEARGDAPQRVIATVDVLLLSTRMNV